MGMFTTSERMKVLRIVELYKEGLSAREIGDLEECSHTHVYVILKEEGVSIRNRKEAAEPQKKWVNCIVCDKLFHPNKNPNRKTCSDACFSIRMRQVQEEDQNSNWKGGFSQKHYQRIAKSNKKWECRVCKSKEKLEVHHIDKDRSNNSVINLEILCGSCHAKIHYEKGDANIKGSPGERAQEEIK